MGSDGTGLNELDEGIACSVWILQSKVEYRRFAIFFHPYYNAQIIDEIAQFLRAANRSLVTAVEVKYKFFAINFSSIHFFHSPLFPLYKLAKQTKRDEFLDYSIWFLV